MIAHFRKHSLLAALILCVAALLPILSPSAEPPKRGKLTHIGMVWLKNAGNDAERERIMNALRQFGREIPEVQSLSFGKPHSSPSKLVDSSFDVCFTMDFEDQAALDRYASHPVHEKAANEIFLPLSAKILFYDFTNE